MRPASSVTPWVVRTSPGLGNTPILAAVLAVVYAVTASLSLQLALVGDNVTPIWPPTGIAVAAMVWFGPRVWPGVFVAAMVVNLPISEELWAAAVTAAGNTLAPLASVALLARTRFDVALARERDAFALAVAALAGMAVSATVGTWVLVATEVVTGGSLGAWSVWWVGDAMGVLIVAPFLFCIPRLPELAEGGWGRRLEVLGLFVVVTLATALVTMSSAPLLFVPVMLLGWAAWRFQQPAAAVTALIVSGIATWAAVSGTGLFEGSLAEVMFELQAFNVAVAITSLVFSALVSSRRRAHADLEHAAANLEARVRERTDELAGINRRLTEEVAVRRSAEASLARSERALSDAQEVARIGSFTWDLRSGEVTWSDELFRIHGHEPGSFGVTFERAIAQVLEEDVARIQGGVKRAVEGGSRDVDDVEYRIVRPDGERRVLLGRGRLSFEDGRPSRMIGTVQDVTEHHAYEREHAIAETLQRALLPATLPAVDGLELAARYVAAEKDAYAGGDWYDVIPLADGTVALVLGDVTGHGIAAASTMGQVRMAIRAYALEGLDPEDVLRWTDALLEGVEGGAMVTVLYVVVDASSGSVSVVNAGHPPPLLIEPGRTVEYLEGPSGLPLGLGLSDADGRGPGRAEWMLEVGSTLVMYTDGLVDRRDLPIQDGLERLRRAADVGSDAADLEHLSDALIGLLPRDAADDVAILTVRRVSGAPADGALWLALDATAEDLSGMRRDLRSWLAAAGAGEDEISDLVLACTEAVSNAIEHAYAGRGGAVEISAGAIGSDLTIEVRDHGAWRPPRQTDRGRGLQVIRGCVDEMTLERSNDGVVVRMRRRLAALEPSATGGP